MGNELKTLYKDGSHYVLLSHLSKRFGTNVVKVKDCLDRFSQENREYYFKRHNKQTYVHELVFIKLLGLCKTKRAQELFQKIISSGYQELKAYETERLRVTSTQGNTRSDCQEKNTQCCQNQKGDNGALNKICSRFCKLWNGKNCCNK